MRNYQISDGVKTASLTNVVTSRLQEEYTTPNTPRDARAVVSYLYRAVDIRGKTLQAVPFSIYRGKVDVTERGEYQDLREELHKLLYLTETSLCLTGAAYAGILYNAFGGNPTLQWFATQTVTPIYDYSNGSIQHFQRAIQNGVTEWVPEDMLYLWLPDPSVEMAPGLAPTIPALKSAGVLAGIDEFSKQFFERGATKAMLLTVEGTPTPEQVQKLETWWRRFISGVKNAYQSIVVSSSVMPQIVGDGLSDIDSEKIVTPRRQDILAALGVPESLVTSSAANYATARQDRLTFLQSTIVPEAEWIASEINKKYLSLLGLRMEFDPSLMEEYQAAEFEKSMGLVPLYDAGIITLNEVRAALGYEPLVAEEEPLQEEVGEEEEATPTLEEDLAEAVRELRDVVKDYALSDETARLEVLMEELKAYDNQHGTEGYHHDVEESYP